MTDDGFQQITDAIRRATEDARPHENCPAAERIWGAVKLELPLTERLEIIDHTTECLACAEAWRVAMTLGDRTASAALGSGRPRSSWMLTGARAAGVLLVIAGLAYFFMRGDAPPVDPPTAQTTPTTQPPPPATAPVVVSLNDGAGRVTLTKDGTLTTSRDLAATEAERVRQALLTRRVPSSSALDDVKTSAGTLMGGAGLPRLGLASPVGTLVEDEGPTLAWFPLAGAHGYEVTISDVAANYTQVVTSPRLRETVWTVPTPLTRGRTYSWQVVAFTEDGQVKAPSAGQPEARFRVLSLESAEAVVKARVAHKDEHLVLGVTYAAAGLLDEAEAEFRALAAANPGSSVAADLLRSVREMRSGQNTADARQTVDQPGVIAALQAFANAYGRLNAADVVKVAPFLGSSGQQQLAADFKQLRSYSISINATQISFSNDGATATARCTITRNIVTNANGAQRPLLQRANVRLQRTPDGWVIAGIDYIGGGR